MSRTEKQLAAIFSSIIVVGIVVFFGAKAAAQHGAESAATRQSQQNYENAIAGCHRANKHYAADNLVIEAAAKYSTQPALREKARVALIAIREQPYVREDGTTKCGEAIHRP